MQYFPDAPQNTETNVGKVLLIGMTGGTGSNVVKGFLKQDGIDLRAITCKIDFKRAALSRLSSAGLTLVEADLEDENSLRAAFAGVSV